MGHAERIYFESDKKNIMDASVQVRMNKNNERSEDSYIRLGICFVYFLSKKS